MTPEEWAKFLRDLSDRENEKGEATITVCAALLDAAKVIERLSAEGAGLRKAARGQLVSDAQSASGRRVAGLDAGERQGHAPTQVHRRGGKTPPE